MTQQRTWSTIGIFIIALVISIPFYSASAYAASVSITKNHGQAGIDTFIDGQGDVWTLEAQITNNVGTVQPNQVKRIINGVQKEFSVCSAGDLGMMCTLPTSLPDGVDDNSIPFRVQFTAGAEQASAAGTLNVDGTAPAINQWNIRQDKQKIILSATVRDQPAICAGLQSVELLDSSGQVVHSVQRDFSRCGENVLGEEVPLFISGEGSELVKLRVRDKLGHERLSEAKRFSYDFAAPQIISPTLLFEELEQSGELFLGSSRKTTSMSVEIVEKGTVEVSATSDSLNFRGSTKAICQSVQKEGYENIQKCTWTNVEIDPDKPISATITAKDDKDNSATATLSRSFTPDVSAPIVSFLGVKKDGVEQKYNELFYVKPGTVEITAEIDEIGSGVKRENILADFTSMNRGTMNPEKCSEIGAQTVCTWQVAIPPKCSGTEVCRISAWAKDNVENEGEKKFTELHIDNVKPVVKKVELLATGEKRYVQTGDTMTLTIHVEEENGVRILVDVKEAVGEDAYANGIAVFDACEPDKEGVQVCTFDIGPVTAGYVSSVDLPMTVTDTAGNEAVQWPETAKNLKGTKGDYTFELLAINELIQPDFWRTGTVAPVGGGGDFIDMDTTEQIPTRIAFKIPLTANTSVSVRKIDLVGGCQPAEGFTFLQRNVLVSNIFAQPVSQSVTPQLILEFAPFNSREYFGVGDEATFSRGLLNMTCTLNIVSQKGNTVITQPEIQEVNFKVPFAFTSIGSKDENLEKKVKDLKDEFWFKTGEVSTTLSKVIDWVNYALNILNVIVAVNQIIDIYSVSVKVASEASKASIVFSGASPAFDAMCAGTQASYVPSWKIAEWLQIPAAVLQCNPNSGVFQNTWYGWYQKNVLEIYNAVTLRTAAGIPASGLYENMYVSAIGLCVPGMIYNLKKFHQVQCRRIYCYQKEVPAGYATVAGCDALYDLQFCEYFAGPGWRLIPGVGAWDAIMEVLQSALTSPLGLVKFGIQAGLCGSFCFTPDAGISLSACKVGMIVTKIGDIIEIIVGAVNNRPDLTSDPFCSQIED